MRIKVITNKSNPGEKTITDNIFFNYNIISIVCIFYHNTKE
jgi:hypothetical protein